MQLSFAKMQGLGNDFVLLDGVKHGLPKNLAHFARSVCDRHFGIGADQVLVLRHSKVADFRMDIFNADGSEVQMCGNGIRCLTKYILDAKLSTKTSLAIETKGGIVKPQVMENHPKITPDTIWVRVDLGAPILEGERIPVLHKGRVVDVEKSIAGRKLRITCVSLGNPHCVVFVSDLEGCPVQQLGSVIEVDSFFPERVNVEFVEVASRKHLRQRTWERGVGETFACGSGAAAVCVASVLTGRADREILVTLRGGDLELFWDEKTGHVFKTGPATTVFSGEIDYAFCRLHGGDCDAI